jgi:choline monooxygenase
MVRCVPSPSARARTPPGAFYAAPAAAFASQVERVFARAWHFAPELHEVRAHGDARGFALLRGALDEPLLAVRDGDATRVLSNACSHRGKELVEPAAGVVCTLARAGDGAATLRCGYHGRRFALDGRCRGAPGASGRPPRRPCHPRGRSGGSLLTQLNKVLLECL